MKIFGDYTKNKRRVDGLESRSIQIYTTKMVGKVSVAEESEPFPVCHRLSPLPSSDEGQRAAATAAELSAD